MFSEDLGENIWSWLPWKPLLKIELETPVSGEVGTVYNACSDGTFSVVLGESN